MLTLVGYSASCDYVFHVIWFLIHIYKFVASPILLKIKLFWGGLTYLKFIRSNPPFRGLCKVGEHASSHLQRFIVLENGLLMFWHWS